MSTSTMTEMFAELGLRTYEDVAEMYIQQGWGCKCCGELQSDAWWHSSGDIYCTRCKKELWNELRVRSTKFPTRAESGLARTVTWVYDPNSQGFEVAAFQRAEHARLFGNA